MRPNILISILLSVLTGLASADTNPSSLSASDTANLLSNANIEGLKALPIHGLNMVKAGGKTFFMSDNGRFVITGTLLDVWNRVAVTELDQVDQIVNRIDLSKMKLKIDDLGPATVGNGKAQVVVFVDPRCPYCGKVQKQMDALKSQYTFKLVPIPVLGPESQSLVVKIGCLLQTPSKDKARDALMRQTYDSLPSELDSKCNREPVQRAMVTAKLFGIDGVPFLIAPDGRTFKGAPDSLADWLENKPVPKAEAVQPPSKAAVVPPDSAKTSNAGEDTKP
jgi:thiol:disulfide interchange protein DsbC